MMLIRSHKLYIFICVSCCFLVQFACNQRKEKQFCTYWQIIQSNKKDTVSFEYKVTQDSIYRYSRIGYGYYGTLYKQEGKSLFIYDTNTRSYNKYFEIVKKLNTDSYLIRFSDSGGKSHFEKINRISARVGVFMKSVSISYCDALSCLIDNQGHITFSDTKHLINDTLDRSELKELFYLGISVPNDSRLYSNCSYIMNEDEYYVLSLTTNKEYRLWRIKDRIPCYLTGIVHCMQQLFWKYYSKNKRNIGVSFK